MTPKFKNLLLRTLFGAIYVALMITGVFVPPFMCVLLCAVACICLFEYANLTSGPADKLSAYLMMGISVIVFSMVCYQTLQPRSFLLSTGQRTMYMTYMMLPALLMLTSIVLSVMELFRRRPCPPEQIGKSLLAMTWIVLPLLLLAAFVSLHPQMALAFFLLIWINDTFAYLGGSLYGRNRMCERISPGKTWEGTFTGLVLTVIAAIIMPSIPFFGSMRLPMWMWAVLAILIVLFGTLGDLLESVFKRNVGVKDSGHLIPGHGGMLDRFDSILLAAVPVILFTILFA